MGRMSRTLALKLQTTSYDWGGSCPGCMLMGMGVNVSGIMEAGAISITLNTWKHGIAMGSAWHNILRWYEWTREDIPQDTLFRTEICTFLFWMVHFGISNRLLLLPFLEKAWTIFKVKILHRLFATRHTFLKWTTDEIQFSSLLIPRASVVNIG